MSKNNGLMEKSFLIKLLLVLCVFGVAFAFAATTDGADGTVGGAAVNGFFTVIQKYVRPIVIAVIIIAAGGFIWAGVEWKFVLTITLVATIAWLIVGDKDNIDKLVTGSSTFVNNLF